MEGILKQLAAEIPAYFTELVKLVSGPKRFVAERLSRGELTLQPSLVFLAISFLIAEILQLPMATGNAVYGIATAAVFTLLFATLGACAVQGAWRIVGGKAPVQHTIAIFFFYAGVVDLFLAVTHVAAMGSLRVIDPKSYLMVSTAAHSADAWAFLNPPDSVLAMVAILVTAATELLGLTAIAVWLTVGWGAYRKLNHLSIGQSVGALMLFAILCIPILILMFLISVALIDPAKNAKAARDSLRPPARMEQAVPV